MNTYNLTEPKAGDAWRNHIKQFEALDSWFNSLSEVTQLWLSQQIDIFAGKYPISGAKKEDIQPVLRWVKITDREPQIGGSYFVRLGGLKDKVVWTKGKILERFDEGLVEMEWLEEVEQPVSETDYLLSGKNGERLLGSIEQLKGGIDNLRDKFFKECVSDNNDWFAETFNREWEQIFEWFKPYLKSNSEPVIDWEGLVNDMLNLLTNIGQLLQPVKSDWQAENCWSDWDEEQLTETVKTLRRLYEIKDQLAQNKSNQLH